MISRRRQALGSLKYWLGSPSLNPNPCLRTDTGSLVLCWDKEEQIASVRVPLMPETMVPRNSRNLVSEGNSVSCVQAGDNGNTSSNSTS